METVVTSVVSSVAAKALVRILEKLSSGAVTAFARGGVEDIVRDLLKREPHLAGPPYVVDVRIAIDEFYAIVGNDNRFTLDRTMCVALMKREDARSQEPNDALSTRVVLARQAAEDFKRAVRERQDRKPS